MDHTWIFAIYLSPSMDTITIIRFKAWGCLTEDCESADEHLHDFRRTSSG